MYNKEEFLNQVLEEINKMRIVLGKKKLDEIPKGVIASISCCPLAKSFEIKSFCSFGIFSEYDGMKLKEELGLIVIERSNANTFIDKEKWAEVTYPQILFDFASAFDRNQFPQLINNRGE